MARRSSKAGAGERISINAIDVAIVLLILFCAIGIFLRYDMENKISEGEGDTYIVEFVCEKVRYTTADYIAVGDTLFFTESRSSFGVVDGAIVSIPSSEEVVSAGKNTTVYYPLDSMIDIEGSIKVSGTQTENGFLAAGNTYIAPNSVIKVSNKYADFEMKVMSIKKAEAN